MGLTRYELPFDDPTPDLAPTAARILEAARRVLARDGFRGLTFETIAREAEENPALIRYHFGSKAGLIAALVDSVLYQEAVQLIEQLTAVPAGEERRTQLLALHEGLPQDTDAYRNFFELIPHVLRDEELRPHLSGLFDWYRKLDAWALKDAGDAEPAAHIAPMALLTVAIADGIALQKITDPDLDVGPAFDLWRRLVLGHVESGGEAEPAG
ncbi:MAG TPA: TetR/AcrR family transcriptional regulator [Thermoleophilia bacterium]|nr:TetR/AcrR family transcriptional regulator [Thermoleophilia bacterium]